MNKVYIVKFTTGSYDEMVTSIEGVYDSLEKAKRYLNKINDICKPTFYTNLNKDGNVLVISSEHGNYTQYEKLEDTIRDITKAYVSDGSIAFEILEYEVY